ncbi:MAG: fused MFS/spermidine synthase [bacterium]
MLVFLSIIFTLSGGAGLVYESIWTRYLGLFVGHSAYAQVLVLVIFLGGMSIGALGVGRRAERVRNPLLWYALVELGVGIIGLAFHDVFVWTTRVAYDSIFPALGPGAMHIAVKWTIAGLLILPQSVLLGTTFPLMTAGTLRLMPERAGRTIALLYFANSLGAAIGVLLAGFALMQWVGLPGTLLVAAMTNIVVAGAAYLASRRRDTTDPHAAGVPEHEPVTATAITLNPSLQRLLLAVSFGTAVSSFVYEIGWIRMLSLVLGSATHSFELMLSAFIFGLAVGAFLVRRRSSGDDQALRRLAHVQLAMGALAVATLPVYARSFDWMADFMAAFTKTPAGYVGYSAARYAICLAVMLPATICAGMTLPLITRLLLRGKHGERALGQVYGANTLGSILGVALAALILLPLVGLKWMIVVGAAIDIGLGFRLLGWDRPEHSTKTGMVRWIPAIAVAAFALIVGATTHFDRGVLTSGVFRYGTAHSAQTPEITYFADGRTATVSVRRIHASNGLSLATNGKPDGSLGPEWFTAAATRMPFTHDASTQVLMPLVALAHVPQARVVAVIGQGTGMSSHTLLGDDRLSRLVTIEIEPEMLRASRQFYPANRRVFDDPRATFALDDARSYFASQGEQYDLILSVPSNPWVAGVSGLFTTEFYTHVRRFMAPHGVFAQWIHLSETNDGLVLSVVRAIAENFPAYALYTVANKDILIVATSDATLPAPDWTVLQIPPIAADLRRVFPITPAMLDALHIVDGATLAPLARTSGANSDFYPTLDLGAERSRYLREGAMGFVGLSGDRFGLAGLLESRRSGVSPAPYSVLYGVPRLDAMELSARVALGNFANASGPQLGAAERARIVQQALASSEPPMDWHVWIDAVRETEETRAGGSIGVADTALYGKVSRYLARQSPPAEARAAVAFLHGLSARDYAETATAALPLVAAALRGDYWLPADLLRDGAVVALIRTGDAKDARYVLENLRAASSRAPNDVRGQLLAAWARRAAVAPEPGLLR